MPDVVKETIIKGVRDMAAGTIRGPSDDEADDVPPQPQTPNKNGVNQRSPTSERGRPRVRRLFMMTNQWVHPESR